MSAPGEREECPMLSTKYRLPDEPPALRERQQLSNAQRERALRTVNDLSTALEALPVVLAQQGEVVCAAGGVSGAAASRMAQQAARAWQQGEQHPAREIIRFDGEAGRLYSVHVAGALTLIVRWQPPLSLTQLRAEAADARERLVRIVEQT